ncbi:hypothetical protein [Desulfovibrio sp. ZJ369]|uniref:hypothetical protein n=1 Tax=Desulfovibrio sp. ZJ369 TaxID=2709793 RepID=UPI0013EDD962|nr:hypothetical protein [Desulfovibrio sp. ZJ369]
MNEFYTIVAEGADLHFVPREDQKLENLLTRGEDLEGYEFFSRLGDPDLMHCAVFRKSGRAGGFFTVYDKTTVLFVAVAETNLAFGLGLGYFGRLVSYARYGADVFENTDTCDA